MVGLNLKFLSSVYAYSLTLEAFLSWMPTSCTKFPIEKPPAPEPPLEPQSMPPPKIGLEPPK